MAIGQIVVSSSEKFWFWQELHLRFWCIPNENPVMVMTGV